MSEKDKIDFSGFQGDYLNDAREGFQIANRFGRSDTYE